MTSILALAALPTLIAAGACWLARESHRNEPSEFVVVTPKRFDVTTARAELVADDMLAVALGAGVVPGQRQAGVES